MTRTAYALTFVAIFAACLAGAFTPGWWLALALPALIVPAALAEHRAALGRAAAQGHAEGRSETRAALLLGATLELGTGLAIGFAIGRALAWLLVG